MTTLVWPAATTPILRAAIGPLLVSTPADRAAGVAGDRLDLAILDDVDAARARAPRIAPGDGVMARGAAGALQRRAAHGIADAGIDVEDRAELLGLLRRQPFVGDAGEPIGVDMAAERLLVVQVVRQQHDAARREHHVVVEFLRQPRPQLVGVAIDALGGRPQVVRAHDGGVAAGVAAAEPALLQHGDVGDAVLLGHVIGGGEAVAAGADDDDVIGRLRLGRTPLLRPILVAAEGLGGEAG